MNKKLLERILIYKRNPSIAKALTVEELTTAFAELFELVRATNMAVEGGKVKGKDGETPQPDVDFMSMVTAQKMLQGLFGDADVTLTGKLSSLDSEIEKRLSALKNGVDAVITDEQIAEA